MTSPLRWHPTPLEVSARACDALNAHDVNGLRTVLADDVVEHIVPIDLYDGREAVLGFHGRLFAAAPDLHVQVEHIAVSGSVVLTTWHLSATFTGAPFEGFEPSGRRVRLPGASTQVVHEGRLIRAEVIFDGASAARQIGMLPMRGSIADRVLRAVLHHRSRLGRRSRTRERVHQPPRHPDDRFQWRPAAVGRADLEDLLSREELAVIATDLAGTVTHWSTGAERLYGWAGAEVLGRPITELTVGPEDEDVAQNIMRSVRETGRWEGEFWVRRKNGLAFLAYVREALLCDEHGAPIGLVGVSIEAIVDGADIVAG